MGSTRALPGAHALQRASTPTPVRPRPPLEEAQLLLMLPQLLLMLPPMPSPRAAAHTAAQASLAAASVLAAASAEAVAEVPSSTATSP